MKSVFPMWLRGENEPLHRKDIGMLFERYVQVALLTSAPIARDLWFLQSLVTSYLTDVSLSEKTPHSPLHWMKYKAQLNRGPKMP